MRYGDASAPLVQQHVEHSHQHPWRHPPARACVCRRHLHVPAVLGLWVLGGGRAPEQGLWSQVAGGHLFQGARHCSKPCTATLPVFHMWFNPRWQGDMCSKVCATAPKPALLRQVVRDTFSRAACWPFGLPLNELIASWPPHWPSGTRTLQLCGASRCLIMLCAALQRAS